MKKTFNLIVWISSLSILLLSCAKDEPGNKDTLNGDGQNMVMVSLGIKGDLLKVEETPLSKSLEIGDLYGVQIYSSPQNEDHYQPYGYGLFIDKSKMQVKLYRDRKYKFKMTAFPHVIYNVDSGYKSVLTGCKSPFSLTDLINDSIQYSENELGQLDGSCVCIHEENTNYFNHSNVDRYYGEINYVPTEDSNVNIEMKRVVAGLTFKIKGLNNQSSLKIEIEEAPTIEIKGKDMTKEITHNSFIGLMGERITGEHPYDHKSYYTEEWFEKPTDQVPLKFTWTNGEQTKSFTQTVILKRKMNYTFNIDVQETFLVSNGIYVIEEDRMWDDDSLVDNIYFGDLIIKNEKDFKAFLEAAYTKVTGDLIFKYWDEKIPNYYWRGYRIKSVGGDFKLIANETCSFNTMHSFPSNGVKIDGSLELIATVPGCFTTLLYFKGDIGKVGGNFRIIGTQGSFTALEDIYCYLDEIGGNLEVTMPDGNSSSIFYGTRFCDLKKIGGDIIIKKIPALKDYCDLKIALQSHTGQFIVSGNGYNPTKEQILAGECSIE